MDRMKMFVCSAFALIAAITVLNFTASAQEDAEQEDLDYADTPYVGEGGTFDAEMAKDYAELVDTYVDEKGTTWEVWLDDIGGQMWEESVDGPGTLGIIYHLFVPDYVYVWRSGYDVAHYYYTNPVSDGYLEYDSEIDCEGFDHCYKWYVWSWYADPCNPTEIRGRGRSVNDYCDSYYESPYRKGYAIPDGSWQYPTETPVCYDAGSYYYYYMRDQLAS
ncbi:secreted protein [sediment metagenome]|uniref:Secreted protein n=1 Tax=sediment metagenome TaxID=749907 RepID=D9PN02_9ZZZZ